MRPRVVVIGPPGSGKSTVGGLLADRLGVELRDSDADVEARAGKTISELFTEDGEDTFRALEEESVAAALSGHEGILALGGGAVLAPRTRELLAGHTVVLLGVGLAEGVRRTGMSVARPLLTGVNPRATYRMLLEERLPVYRAVATVEIDTDERTAEEVVTAIVERLPTTATDRERSH